jgi:hypothetical protein
MEQRVCTLHTPRWRRFAIRICHVGVEDGPVSYDPTRNVLWTKNRGSGIWNSFDRRLVEANVFFMCLGVDYFLRDELRGSIKLLPSNVSYSF